MYVNHFVFYKDSPAKRLATSLAKQYQAVIPEMKKRERRKSIAKKKKINEKGTLHIFIFLKYFNNL